MPSPETLVLGAFALSALAAVAYVALARKVLHVLMVFFYVLFAVAGLFVLGGAEFVALAQIVVYVGGVAVLLLFGLMLTGRDNERSGLPLAGLKRVLPAGAVVAGLALGGVWAFSGAGLVLPATPPPPAETHALGATLLGAQAPLFELVSLLLLLALVGAAYYARRGQ